MLFRFADRVLVPMICFAAVSLLAGSGLFAQANSNQPTKKPATPKGKQEIEIPPPEVVSLTTKDNVNLTCTFFAAPQDKERRHRKRGVGVYSRSRLARQPQ